MAMHFDIGPYDPCPCGSGKKYKFCCAEKAKANRHGKFPIGTVAYYGPDDTTVTKIAAAVILRENAEPIMERWTSTTVTTDPKVADQIKKFFAKHGVKNIVDAGGIIGCPHEEGEDFPVGQECPFCPFWEGKQGINVGGDNEDSDWEDDELEDETDEDEDEDPQEEDGDPAGDPYEPVRRMEAIAGDETEDRDVAVDNVLAYLKANLTLACEVTGIEDFRWEERYVLGGWDPKEYRKLKKTQPSYTDRYQLLSLSHEGSSEWMMFWDEDISAHVRRNSDGKEFVLGLAELKATDKKSQNYQLVNDYAIWFVNTR
jgi:hypothetical protein